MKIAFFSILALTLLTFSTQSMADLDDGLAAYYPFNGNANDESGNGNHGTVIGPTLTADRFGNVESAYSFDGLDDFIALGSNLLLDTPSISLWVRTSSEKYGPENSLGVIRYRLNGFGISMNGPFNPAGGVAEDVGKVRFQLVSGDLQTETAFEYQTETNTYNDDNWHHMVLTYDGLAFVVYIDGDPVFNVSGAAYSPVFYGTGELAIGRDGGHSSDYFQGIIDDVRIYNRALSANEVESLYDGYSPTEPFLPCILLLLHDD